MAEGELDRAQDFVSKDLQAMEGYEVPLAQWKVHATAYELHQRMKQRDRAKERRELRRATIRRPANSCRSKSLFARHFSPHRWFGKSSATKPKKANSRAKEA